LFLDTFIYSTNFDKSSVFSTKTDSRFALETIAKKGKKWYNIVVSDEKGRKSERRKGMEEQRKATAEELAKKVAELMKEELVGVTSVDGTKISFYLAGGQKFCLTVTEAED
jgi:predicted AAA+ superfamily ATPase